MKNNHDYDAIILGAGGAGLMAAAIAGQRGARVLVIDHAKKAGKKILISGGGRCNFTNMHISAERYLSENPHFAKSALARYTQWDFLDLVAQHKIAWHEKTLGQLFCDQSARQIVAMLLEECEKGGVEIRLETEIGEIQHHDNRFHLPAGSAPHLVVATGGPSIPKMGATGVAYDIAKQFDIRVITPRPALVPLVLGEKDQAYKAHSGLAVEAIASVGPQAFEEAVLFTHRGLSGPAILQISSYWSEGAPVDLNIMPNAKAILLEAKNSQPRAQLKSVLATYLPQRLASLLSESFKETKELANLSDARLSEIAERLEKMRFYPTGTEGFAKAEVTAGGVDTDALSSKTMEAKKLPGLFFIGEAVDVTGWLGGYNFQWAWSSAVACAHEIASRVLMG